MRVYDTLAMQFQRRTPQAGACRACGRTDVKHFAKGLCKSHYDSWVRYRRWIFAAFAAGTVPAMPRKPLCFYCAKRLIRPRIVRGVCVCSEHVPDASTDVFTQS